MTDLFVFLFIAAGLIMLSVKFMYRNILLLMIQSFSLSILAFYLGYLDKGLHMHIFIVGLLVLIVKVIILTWVLYRLAVRLNTDRENTLSFSPIVCIFAGVTLVGLTYAYIAPMLLKIVKVDGNLLSAAVSAVFLGCFYMISRRCVLNQVIGVIMIENGLFLSALAIVGGMPLIIELGIFFDLLIGVLVMGAITVKINQSFHSLDIHELKRLRG